jgi:hypothetical protein
MRVNRNKIPFATVIRVQEIYSGVLIAHLHSRNPHRLNLIEKQGAVGEIFSRLAQVLSRAIYRIALFLPVALGF